ncbi:MAG: hypothetical protein RIQ50_597, partial [Bacteroidota bacterium]
MNHNHDSRRKFLKQSALAGTAIAVPSLFVKAHSNRKMADKVRLAVVGIGNQGASDLMQFHKSGFANFVAFCDTDMGAPQTQAVLKQFPDVPRFKDFRELFDKMGNQFDAIAIGVPDHSHFAITMMALAQGKHVYVEKPMARTFNEVELMMKAAAKRPELVTQMGNQGHSEGNYFQFKAWTEAGIIKDVTAITAH